MASPAFLGLFQPPLPTVVGRECPEGVIGCETAASLSGGPEPTLALCEAKFPTLPRVSLLVPDHGCAVCGGQQGDVYV